MSKVKFNLEIPRSLADITLDQYQRYLKIAEANKDDENATEFLNLKSLEVFCGLDIKLAYKVPMSTFNFALEHLGACFNEETPLIRRFKIKDSEGVEQEMGLMPKLEDMVYGEYVDLDKYFSDWQEMHKAMAVLLRPIDKIYKESYTIREYNGTEAYGDAMKQLPMNIVFGVVVFFYRLGMKLSESTMVSLEKKVERSSQYKGISPKDGAGILLSMRLHREMLEDSMKSQRYHYIKQ